MGPCDGVRDSSLEMYLVDACGHRDKGANGCLHDRNGVAMARSGCAGGNPAMICSRLSLSGRHLVKCPEERQGLGLRVVVHEGGP